MNDTKLNGNFLVHRRGDPPMFGRNQAGEVTANLTRYAIIPREAFDAMGGEESEGFKSWSQENRHPQT